MTDKKISALDAAVALTGVEDVPIVQSGDTVRTTTQDIADLASSGITPAALTKVDDTNVTLTLGGTPATALLQATSITVGWSSTLSLARGGTAAALVDPNIDRVMGWDDSAGTVKFMALADLNTEATPANGDYVLIYDAAGNLLKTDWSNLPGGSSTANLIIGTSTITNGTSTRVLYDLAGIVEEAAKFTIESGNANALILGSGEYQIGGSSAFRGHDTNANWFLAGSGNTSLSGGNNYGFGGYSALSALTSGSQNIAIGTQAGLKVNSGGSNTLVGGSAVGGELTSGGSNTFIGAGAGNSLSTTGSNTAVGKSAMGSTTGVDLCVAIGVNAMVSATAGTNCLAIGQTALSLNSGDDNLGIGAGAIGGGGGGTSGGRNTAVGTSSLNNATSAEHNTAIGYTAGMSISTGDDNTLIGYATGTVSSGSRNIVIGASCDIPTLTASNQLSIGNYIYGTGLDSTGSTISAGSIGLGIKAPTTNLDVDGPIKAKGYTIATTLPVAGVVGRRAYVTDSAAAPVFGAVIAGGGAVVVPVFDNGANWIYG